MIRIPINGDIDAALDKFNTAKKEQEKAFNERVAAVLAGPAHTQSAKPSQPLPPQQPRPPAPSYESILARSRRMG
ncbi:MAG: hypothetical protein JSR72_04775 [Proteobacteria bacterium]|nr:hypothetical protein [Pseudomonadota bacterium]